MNRWRLEAIFWLTGLAMVALYGLARADAVLSSTLDLAHFELPSRPNTELWSPSRVKAYRASLPASTDPLIGALIIRSVGLAAPIYRDASELHLNRGAGLIAGTAMPGELGNVGIAGHRDGFFRALKDVHVGDAIEITTETRSYRYRVSTIVVVQESDARLLERTNASVVTLVTCHPFYFVGHAQQRFIVRGVLESTSARGRQT
jgi:sortase A